MKRRLLFLLVLFASAFWTMAERVDVATARKIAESVAAGNSGGLRSASEPSLIYAAAPGQSGTALRGGAMTGAADYFVFNIGTDQGFVIVSGDDRVRPVLGYSDTGKFDPDNLPENLRGMLASYQDQITWAESQNVEATPEIAAEWSRGLSGTALRNGGVVRLETALWGQGSPYNWDCPYLYDMDSYGQPIEGDALTGCVATAMGIIMKYHKYPTRAVNPPATNSYYEDGYAVTKPIDYSMGYDWTNMLDDYGDGYTESQGNEVAHLLFHCGVNVEMNYGLEFSGANTPKVAKALAEVFGYSPSVRYLPQEAYRWTEWKAMIREELDGGYPLIYDGQSYYGGHAFICDGYDSNGLFHINWGWGGMSNGYFQLSVLDDDNDGIGYSMGQGAILDIRPNPSGERYYIAPYLTSASYNMSELNVSVDFSMRYYALYDHMFYLELGVVNADGTISQAPTRTQSGINLEANVGGWINMSGISRRISLPSPLAEGQYVALLCSTDGGETWEVMRTLENVPLGINANGVVGPAQDDPDEPEQTMNVNISWNQFKGFMEVSSSHIGGISYLISFAKEDVVLRYTLKDYNAWSDAIQLSSSDAMYGDYTPVSVAADGSFETTVSLSDLSEGYYQDFLQISSTKAGTLTYDIAVYAASDAGRTNPTFEQKGNEITFVNPLSGVITPNPITGSAGVEIPFTLTIKNVDPVMSGKALKFSASLQCFQTDGVKLYYVDGDERKEFELTYYSDTYLYSTEEIPAGMLTEGKVCSFLLFVPEVPMIPSGYRAYVSLSATLDGSTVSLGSGGYATLSITGKEMTYYQIKTTLSHIRLENAITQVQEGEDLELNLIADNGYSLPNAITIKVGGQTLNANDYSYASSYGYLSVSAEKITGDIEIIATAEPIPAPIYMVTIGQLENLTADMPEGGHSVESGKEVTITLTAAEGYLVPNSITLKSGDNVITEGYTYKPSDDYENATLTISSVMTDLQIYANAVAKKKYFSIKTTLTNLSSDQPLEIQVEENASFSFILTPAEGYRLPDGITIMSNQTPLAQGTDYTYDKGTGRVEILKVTSNLTVYASAIDDRHYGVVFDLEGVTIEETADEQYEINATPVFSLDLNAAEGYVYDGSITVKMGERTLNLDTDYEYVSENNHFALKVPLTGTLTIIAKGTKKQYSVTLAAEGLTSDFAEGKKVAHGDNLTFILTPIEGYDLPDVISVSVGGTTLSEGYTYSRATGEVTIQKVTGNVVITVEGVLKSYDVTFKLTNLTFSGFTEGTKVAYGDNLTFKLSAEEGCELPVAIMVTMGGKTLTKDEDYSYNQATGEVTIPKVTGLVGITAEGVEKVPVVTTGENLLIDGPTEVLEGSDYQAKITPATGYKLPYAIEVRMGGRKLTVNEDYVYNNGYSLATKAEESLALGEIRIWNVNGPINITAKGVKDGQHEVVLSLMNLTSTPASFVPQDENSKIELTLTPYDGYELPSYITVTMGGKKLTAGTDYTYVSGKFTLEKISDLLIITAVGEEIYVPDPDPEPDPTPDPDSETYTVTLPVVEGAVITAQGSTTVEEGKSFSFTVDVKEGYIAENMVVKANGTELLPDANGRYTITNVWSNILITVTGIEEVGVGIESAASIGVKAWSADGCLHICLPEAGTAYIISTNGKLYKILTLPEGETVTAMPQGVYFVRIGCQSYKLRF